MTSAKELDGATVCIQTGTTTELNLADFFKVNSITYQPVPIQTTPRPPAVPRRRLRRLHHRRLGPRRGRATYENPDDYVILPEIISKEPLGPVVRQGDNQWADIVRWTLLRAGRGRGARRHPANVDEMAATAGQPRGQPPARHRGRPRRDVRASTTTGPSTRSRPSGNYGEIFARNIGEGTPIEHRPRPERASGPRAA